MASMACHCWSGGAALVARRDGGPAPRAGPAVSPPRPRDPAPDPGEPAIHPGVGRRGVRVPPAGVVLRRAPRVVLALVRHRGRRRRDAPPPRRPRGGDATLPPASPQRASAAAPRGVARLRGGGHVAVRRGRARLPRRAASAVPDARRRRRAGGVPAPARRGLAERGGRVGDGARRRRGLKTRRVRRRVSVRQDHRAPLPESIAVPLARRPRLRRRDVRGGDGERRRREAPTEGL